MPVCTTRRFLANRNHGASSLASHLRLAHLSAMRSTGERFDYDLAVIGGGSGGYAAARTAVAEGLKTVVIEGGEEVGGLCILRGCMPTKALLYAAEVMHLASHPQPWGIRTDNVRFDFAQVMARKNALIKDFADYRRQQLANGKFKFLRALARFTDPHTLELSTGDKLTAANFVIATGSVVAPSPLPQLDDGGLSDQRHGPQPGRPPRIPHRAGRRPGGRRVRAVLRPLPRPGDCDPA